MPLHRLPIDIIFRIQETGDDFFGSRAEVLLSSLDWDDARPYLMPEAVEANWHPVQGDHLDEVAAHYYEFALGKIENHRGLSAQRSVDKLTEYAWLLGRDDIVTAMDDADYTNYGAPKVLVFGTMLGLPFSTGIDKEAILHMAAGQPCYTGCEEGCGR